MSRKNLMMGIFTLLSVFLSGSIVYGAESENNTIAEEKIIDSINKECSIDLLYEKRGEYCIDCKNNYKIIEAIDNRLERLGVEEITYREVLAKLEGNKNSRVALNPSTSIKWTSTRQTTVYRGKTYEIQIIRGVGKNANELYNSYVNITKKGGGKKAAAINVIGVVVNKIAGELPYVGDGIGTIQTVYDIYKGIVSGLSTQTVISDISAVYTVSMSAEYLYAFVKYSGDVDAGKQILGYAGNNINFECNITIPMCGVQNGKIYPSINNIKRSGIIKSPYYNSYIDKASANFYSYKSGNSNISVRYEVLSVKLKCIDGSSVLLKVPTPNSGY